MKLRQKLGGLLSCTTLYNYIAFISMYPWIRALAYETDGTEKAIRCRHARHGVSIDRLLGVVA